MSRLKILIPILLSLILGCTLLHHPRKEDYKTGVVSLNELKQYLWFKEEYKNYTLSEKGYDSLLGLNNLKIIIVGGEWCSDTRLQLPRFIKILETKQFSTENLKIVFVNQEKQIPKDYEKFQIKFVPTFIIIDKTGNEQGRIVESPIKNLEDDLLKIITKTH